MKLKEIISPSTVVFTIILIISLVLNTILGIHPLIDYINFIESERNYFLVPLTIFVPAGLFVFDRIRYKKLLKEKSEIFYTTVHTVQDIVQDSNARMQLLIHEMEQEKVSSKNIKRATEIFDNSNELLTSLYKIDPLKAKVKSHSEIIKIFQLDKD